MPKKQKIPLFSILEEGHIFKVKTGKELFLRALQRIIRGKEEKARHPFFIVGKFVIISDGRL